MAAPASIRGYEYERILARCIIQFRAGTDSWPSSLAGPVRVAWCGGIGAIRWLVSGGGCLSRLLSRRTSTTPVSPVRQHNQQPSSSVFLSQQTSEQYFQHNNPAKRTGWEVKPKTKEKSTCPSLSAE
jgi:hypothetical protein